MPSAAAREVITAPPTLARDLLNATVTASTRSRTPACSTAPRPAAPSTPRPCASSTTSRAPNGSQSCGDLRQRRDLAGHRVDAVDDDDRPGARIERVEALAQRLQVVVPEAADGAPAGRGPGVHAGVRVRVDEQDVAGAADGRQQRQVGVDPGRGQDRGLGAVVVGELLLEREVQPRGAVEDPAAGGAGAVLPDGGLGGLDDPGVAGEAEVVVAAQVDPVAAVVVPGHRLGRPGGRHGVRGRAGAGVLAEESPRGGSRAAARRGPAVRTRARPVGLARELPSHGAGSPGCS